MQDFTDGVKQELTDVSENISENFSEISENISDVAENISDLSEVSQNVKIFHKPPMPLTQGLLYVNLTALLFGTSAVLIKSASETDMPPEYTLPLRFTIAALCFAPQIVRGLKDARIRDAGVKAGFWLFIGYALQAVGLQSTTAARGSFALAFTVIAIPLLLPLVEPGRKIENSQWAASVIALTGVGLLTTSGGDFQVGDALCLGSATLFGFHKILVEKYCRQIDDGVAFTGVQILVITALAYVWGGGYLVTHVGDASYTQTIVDIFQNAPWLVIAFLGLVTTSATLFLEVEALKVVPVPLAALVYTTEPLWGALFAYLFIGDRWGPQGWVGAALILGASVGSQLLKKGGVLQPSCDLDDHTKLVLKSKKR